MANAIETVATAMTGTDCEERAMIVVVGELDAVRMCRGLHIAAEGDTAVDWSVFVQNALVSDGLITLEIKRGPGGVRLRKSLTAKGRAYLKAQMPRRMRVWEEKRV